MPTSFLRVPIAWHLSPHEQQAVRFLRVSGDSRTHHTLLWHVNPRDAREIFRSDDDEDSLLTIRA